MDIAGGLSAASTALAIVKQIREIDKSVDEATFKLAIADLTVALSDTKIALSDAKIEVDHLAKANFALKEKLANSIPQNVRPKCEVGIIKFESKRAVTRARLDMFGVEKWTMACNSSECDYTETKIHDPAGMVSKKSLGHL